MKLGMIARADNSGLGVQTWEFARHMNPDKVMVIDVGDMHNDTDHCNKRTFLDRYPGATVVKGWNPSPAQCSEFLDGLDVVFSCETFYNPNLAIMAKYRGIKTVLQPNWEMYPDGRHTLPDLMLAPSTWNLHRFPKGVDVRYMPVPIATDRFEVPGDLVCTDIQGSRVTRFLHIVGRPAVHDRNGTEILLKALKHVKSDIEVTIKTQAKYIDDLIWKTDDVPDNVKLRITGDDVDNYWELYKDQDVLIMPRRYGGLCLPVNEAIGAGMPVIMSDIEPNRGWLPDEWLVPAWYEKNFWAYAEILVFETDHHDLAWKIDQFAKPEYLSHRQYEARELAKQYSWDTLKGEYDAIFKALAESTE